MRLKSEDVSAVRYVDYYDSPELLGEYGDYNLVGYRQWTFGASRAAGVLDLTTEKGQSHPLVVRAASVEDAKQMIDWIKAANRAPDARPSRSLRRSFKAERSPLRGVRSAAAMLFTQAVEWVGKQTERSSIAPADATPVLLRRRDDFNIVRYGPLYYACPLSLGFLDLRSDRERQSRGILVAETERQIEALIDMVSASNSDANASGRRTITKRESSAGPQLVLSERGHNFVAYDGLFYGCPISLGQINLTNEEGRRSPGVLVGKTLEDVRSMVDQSCQIDGYSVAVAPAE
jgi:hypothetical protein